MPEEEFDYCTACDEPLFVDRAYWTCNGEAFCDYCGSRLPRPVRYPADPSRGLSPAKDNNQPGGKD